MLESYQSPQTQRVYPQDIFLGGRSQGRWHILEAEPTNIEKEGYITAPRQISELLG